jgi:hypothetical protein
MPLIHPAKLLLLLLLLTLSTGLLEVEDQHHSAVPILESVRNAEGRAGQGLGWLAVTECDGGLFWGRIGVSLLSHYLKSMSS